MFNELREKAIAKWGPDNPTIYTSPSSEFSSNFLISVEFLTVQVSFSCDSGDRPYSVLNCLV